jgi:SagB-type dehydrogenase family enzyme
VHLKNPSLFLVFVEQGSGHQENLVAVFHLQGHGKCLVSESLHSYLRSIAAEFPTGINEGGSMIKTCLDYHQATSYDRSAMSGHSLDWANQPKVFKEYTGISSLPLPKEVQIPKGKLSAILGSAGAATLPESLDLEMLSLILLLSYTHTARARYPEGDFFFRSAASAGALYPTEVYVACHGIKGIDSGLYHFDIRNHSIHPLRMGEISGLVTGPGSRLTLFLSAIFFRSAWKYRARAYRYHLLDTGHVVENLSLALKALNLPFSLTYDFDDAAVNRFLGLNEEKEVALAIVDVPGGRGTSLESEEPASPLSASILQSSRVSAKETDYSAIREIHEAGSRHMEGPRQPALSPKSGERGLLKEGMIHALGITPKAWTPIRTPMIWPEVTDYPDAVFHRRSRRNFVKKALSKESMDALLHTMCRSEGSSHEESLAVGFLVGRAEGMEPGFYLCDREEKAWAIVSPGQFMARSTSICLDQAWLVNAGVHFLFLANLELLEKAWGPRGYRHTMLAAGRFGQRLYVAAEALGMGCCGIGALYDKEAMEMLGLNPISRLLYLVAVGNIKRA